MSHRLTRGETDIREFKQITAAGAATATIVDEAWPEVVAHGTSFIIFQTPERIHLKMKECNELEKKDRKKDCFPSMVMNVCNRERGTTHCIFKNVYQVLCNRQIVVSYDVWGPDMVGITRL